MSEDISATQSSVMSTEVFQNSWCISEYAENVIAYIAGYISRSITKQLNCDVCWTNIIGNKSLSDLQNRKNQGGLLPASKDVVEICTLAEKTLRSFQNIFNTKNLVHKIIIATLPKLPSYIFDNHNHMLEQTVLSDHRMQLIKIVLKKYLNVRLHHEGASRQDTIIRLRNKYNKLILFNNM